MVKTKLKDWQGGNWAVSTVWPPASWVSGVPSPSHLQGSDGPVGGNLEKGSSWVTVSADVGPLEGPGLRDSWGLEVGNSPPPPVGEDKWW